MVPPVVRSRGSVAVTAVAPLAVTGRRVPVRDRAEHNLGVIVIRRATAADAPFLREMLAVAVDWRADASARSISELMADPALARYVADWPRQGDVGFVAEDGATPIGAAWWRLFSHHDSGYGFVDESTPELSTGVVAEARGGGVGTLLLRALIGEARRSDLPALSLSVERDNPAAALYERLGFEARHREGGSVTMALTLGK